MTEQSVFFVFAGLFLCAFAASVLMRSTLNALMTQTASVLILSVLAAILGQKYAAFALFALPLICVAAFALFDAAAERVGDDEKPLPRKIYAFAALFMTAAVAETAVLCLKSASAVQIEALERKNVSPDLFGGDTQILMLCGALAAVCAVGAVIMCGAKTSDAADAAKKGS